MIEQALSDPKLSVLFSMTLIICLSLPGISACIWQDIQNAMTSRKMRRTCRKKQKQEARIKKYWEIDMRNFK